MRCAAGHSYDVARSGYVNLHRPGIKSNARSGDPEDMVTARRAFLARGHYDRYVREAAAFLARCGAGSPKVFVDAACGEGHHTLIFADALSPALTVGIDASKRAADLAQKSAYRRGIAASGAGLSSEESSHAERGEMRFIAGNIFDMPLRTGCADVISVLFAPVPYDEALRVLRPGGALLVCSAGRDHLIELRRAIYDEVRYKDSSPVAPEGFSPAERENVTYRATLDRAALGELFEMTPFCRRAAGNARERLLDTGGGEMTVSVDLAVFRKL